MHILLVGHGGREHALAWKIAQSPQLTKLTVTPAGNPGIADLAEEVTLKTEAIPDFAHKNSVDLVVVGPEMPLAEGLADALAARGIPCFGPAQAAAQLETSKGFTRNLCAQHNIPSPEFGQFSDTEDAKKFLRTLTSPYVIKADGLAAGKGVVIAQTLEEADKAVADMLGGQFGAASKSVVIEEFLTGPEVSLFALTDGETIIPFGTAQDHKRAFDGDLGPNTGGMGGFSPSPLETPTFIEEVVSTILQPTVDALNAQGIRYRGVLYAGLMVTEQGPKLIEYNCRFGDPECQMLMRRLISDIVPALMAAATDTLAGHALEWHAGACANIVYAAKGYPGAYDKGSVIAGLTQAKNAASDIEIFHAGTKAKGDTLSAIGGRVLGVTALAEDLGAALDGAYTAIAEVQWPEGFYRTDIGKAHRSL